MAGPGYDLPIWSTSNYGRSSPNYGSRCPIFGLLTRFDCYTPDSGRKLEGALKGKDDPFQRAPGQAGKG